MNEIYWITRLDAINCAFGIATAICAIITIICLCIVYISSSDYDSEEEKKKLKNTLHAAKRAGIVTFVLLVCNIFIPTTKEAYLIYGVGGTIDYVKNNKEANKIPDKAIKALNIFLDNECKSKTDSIKK